MKLLGAIIFVLLSVLSPCFVPVRGLPSIRGEDGILLIFLLGLCVFPGVRLKKCPAGHKDHVTIAFAIMVVTAFLSICFSSLQKTILINDFMILPMLGRLWLIYKCAQSISAPSTRRLGLYALAVSIGVSALIGIIQAHNIGGMSSRITAFYVRGPVQEALWEAIEERPMESRIGGTHGDPRQYGAILVIGLAVCGSLYLYSKQYIGRLVSFCIAPVCLVALVYTMSRTAFLTAVAIAVIAMVIYQQTRGIEVKTLALWLVFLVIGAAVFVSFLTDASKARLFRTDTTSFKMSSHARKRDFLTPFNQALENPALFILGKGPSKADTRTTSHNDFGWYFQRFGLPGLCFYLFLLGYGFSRAYTMLKRERDPDEGALHMAALLIFLNWLLFAMAENIIRDSQLMALYMFMMGLISPAASVKLAGTLAPAQQPKASGFSSPRRSGVPWSIYQPGYGTLGRGPVYCARLFRRQRYARAP